MVFISPLAFNGKFYYQQYKTAYIMPELVDPRGIDDLHNFVALFGLQPEWSDKYSYVVQYRRYEVSASMYERAIKLGAIPLRVDDWFRWVEAKKRCFVFGSNMAGRHGAGAALHATKRYGAIRGCGAVVQGSSYAIPTKSAALETLPLGDIKRSIDRFVEYASGHTETTFFVTRIGCGLAGLTDEIMCPLFAKCGDNCVFDKRWVNRYFSVL